MIGCGRNAKNKLTVNYLYLAEKRGAQIHELHEVHEIKPLPDGGFEVHSRHPGWMQRAAHLDHHIHRAAQVIVSAHAYGSAKLLHRMKHVGTLPGLSDQLGQNARTNSEQLISIVRPYADWKRDPDKIHITPGSVSITSGVWPDAQTSIEPVYYGVGSDIMAFALTYHQQGAQKHPVEGWLKELIEHPSKVLGRLDARHWSERQVVMLCMQTSDTSIELYWKDDMLRSRYGSGTPPSAHIPVVEDFADRLARKMHGDQAALWFEVAQSHCLGAFHRGHVDRRASRSRRGRSLSARVRISRPARYGWQRDARQPRREPVAHDHRARRARDVLLAESRATPTSDLPLVRPITGFRRQCRINPSCQQALQVGYG